MCSRWPKASPSISSLIYGSASSLTMHRIDGPGDYYTFHRSNDREVLCANPLPPADHVGVNTKMLDGGGGMCLAIPFSQDLFLCQGESLPIRGHNLFLASGGLTHTTTRPT
jgi:hypothetical protein